MSNQVTATGMQVKATSDGNLLIAKADSADDADKPADSIYNTTTNLSTDSSSSAYGVVKLQPASTINLANWYSSTASAPTAYTSAGTYSAATDGTNYITRYVYLKSVDSAATVYLNTIKVSGVTFGSNTTNPTGHFYDSLRVGILYEDGKYAIYCIDHTGSNNGRAYGSYDNAGTPATGVTTVPAEHYAEGTYTLTSSIYTFTPTDASNDNYCEDLAVATPELVKIFIWFEGEDATCYTNNIGLNDVSVDISFAVK